MDRNREMRALDDELLVHVSGGINTFGQFFGRPDAGAAKRDIPLPVPTAAKECFGPSGLHEYLPGSAFCTYCGKPRPAGADSGAGGKRILGPGVK